MSTRNPPLWPPPVLTATAASLLEDAKHNIARSRELHSSLVQNIQPGSATFENAIIPLALAENALITASRKIIFHEEVHPDAGVREASAAARELLEAFDVETHMNEPLFRLVDAVYHHHHQQQDKPARARLLDEESLRLLEKIRRDHVASGLSLPAGPRRERLAAVRLRLGQLESEFQRNLSAAKSGGGDHGVWFSRAQLEGVPADVVAGLETSGDGGLLRVGFGNSQAFAVLRCPEETETRRRMYVALENMVPGNVALLKEAVVLRDEAARLLGFRDNAAFRIESKMAKTPGNVHRFLGELKEGLADGARDEIRRLKQLKRQHLEARGEKTEDRLFLWDASFYNNLSVKERFSVDQNVVSEYFALDTVVPGMLAMFEQIFGFQFSKVKSEDVEGRLWHKDVQCFGVWNAEDMGGDFIGYLYLDLYPREGKVSNGCSRNITPGLLGQDLQWQQHAATLLLCSFPKPTAARPSLLRHNEVVLLFHELGHCIHDLASRTRFARLYGPDGTPDDFSEAPSQLLEFWFWTPSVLQAIGRHYSYLTPESLAAWERAATEGGRDELGERRTHRRERPPERMPAEMVERLVASKAAKEALVTLRQVAIGLFDMAVHSPSTSESLADVDLCGLYNGIRREVCQLADPSDLGEGDDWGHGFAIYPHLMSGYDAGFYAYLFSRVYAADMFYSKFQADPMNTAEGRRYRRAVLEKGSIRDEMAMLVEYLGREPKGDAFYRELGLV